MVSVAVSNLFHQKSKTFLSISGVVVCVIMIFTINGVYNGMDYVMDSMIYNTQADLWITQDGTSGSIHSPSLLPISISNQLETIDGIEEFTPLIRTAATYSMENSDILLFVNSVNSNTSLGQPWKMIKGNSTPKEGEIIIDETFSRISGRDIGDEISIHSRNFTIIGISGDGNIMVGYLVFLSLSDATQMILPNMTNSFIIKVADNFSPDTISNEIASKIPNVRVQNSQSIADAYKDEVLGSFVPIILVLNFLTFFSGVLIIGLLIYMMTIEKSKEYGIIKSMGANNRRLYGIVLSQALIISTLGYIFGVALSFPFTNLIRYTVPEFYVVLFWNQILLGFPLFLVTGIFASLLPLKRIVNIDPAVVFNS